MFFFFFFSFQGTVHHKKKNPREEPGGKKGSLLSNATQDQSQRVVDGSADWLGRTMAILSLPKWQFTKQTPVLPSEGFVVSGQKHRLIFPWHGDRVRCGIGMRWKDAGNYRTKGDRPQASLSNPGRKRRIL